MSYGITDQGFVLKRFEVCKAELIDAFKEAFGENLNVDDLSVAGIIINIMAKREADVWESQQAAYNATRPASASGLPLDDVVTINGLSRLPATQSSAYITMYGDDNDIISQGFTVSRDDDGAIQFLLPESVTISKDNAIEAQVDVTAAAAGDYTITFDSTAYTYTAGGGDTLSTITEGLALILQAALSSTHVVDYDAATDYRITIRPIDNITAFTISLTGDLEFNSIGTLGLFYSTVSGQISAPSGTLTVIETPDNADSVYNREPAAVGRLEESDAELRIRQARLYSGINGGSIPSIETRILSEVTGVSFCRCYENDSDTTDGDGIPPHSIEVVVIGGDSQDIADKIFEVKSGGIGTHGDITNAVTDSNGVSHSISFSRQDTLYAWLEYTITTDTEEAFPSDGADQIKLAAVAYCEAEFTVGRDLLVNKCAVPAYGVDGVRDVSVRIATTTTPGGTPSYGTSNIVLTPKQIAEFDETRVVILEA